MLMVAWYWLPVAFGFGVGLGGAIITWLARQQGPKL